MAKRKKSVKMLQQQHEDILRELERAKDELARDIGRRFIDDFDIYSIADYNKFVEKHENLIKVLEARGILMPVSHEEE